MLVVEDDPTSLEVLELVLREEGWDVLRASSAEDALACVDEHGAEVDLVVTDVHLPGMSGLELAERVRARCPRVRVALLTGDTHPPPGSFDAFVRKPADLDHILTLVRKLLACEPTG